MFGKLGLVGIVGLLLVLLGLAVVAWQDPIIAAGIALMLSGVGLLAKGMINAVIASFGFGNAV